MSISIGAVCHSVGLCIHVIAKHIKQQYLKIKKYLFVSNFSVQFKCLEVDGDYNRKYSFAVSNKQHTKQIYIIYMPSYCN